MKQYRKKPIAVGAAQFTGLESADSIILWARSSGGQAISYHAERLELRAGNGEVSQMFEPEHIRIKTLEGVMKAGLGDWIIRGVSGEFYPCKPDIFAATYDAEEPTPTYVPETIPQKLTVTAKRFRKDLDDVLQKMKALRDEITTPGILLEGVEDQREVVANHVISLRAVEDAVMRQGMVLKCIGATPNPYPNSYKPESPVIEPTADGIKL